MTNNQELKPCPFCGCQEAGTRWHHGYWSVNCGYMHDTTPSQHCFQDWGEFETEEEATEAWNRRAVNNNYISINGKKIPLTNEQVEQIKNAGTVKDNPFERVEKGQEYFYINNFGGVEKAKETLCRFDDELFLIANYCTDRKLLKQRALHETLNRLLWRFSMTHGGDEINWSDADSYRYIIFYNHCIKSFGVYGTTP